MKIYMLTYIQIYSLFHLKQYCGLYFEITGGYQIQPAKPQLETNIKHLENLPISVKLLEIR